MIFTILAILAILLTVAGVSTYLHLAPKLPEGSEAPSPEAPEASQNENPASPSPLVQVNATGYLIVANPHLNINGEHVPIGTILTRNAQGTWSYGSTILTTDSVERAVREGYLSSNLGDARMTEALRRLNDLTTSSLTASMQAVQGNFEAMARDFARMTRPSRVGNSTPLPPAARPIPATTPAEPAPVNPTPKSAIDRLLTDDLIPDDDVGVKPKV